jgi:hypothetical protein
LIRAFFSRLSRADTGIFAETISYALSEVSSLSREEQAAVLFDLAMHLVAFQDRSSAIEATCTQEE